MVLYIFVVYHFTPNNGQPQPATAAEPLRPAHGSDPGPAPGVPQPWLWHRPERVKYYRLVALVEACFPEEALLLTNHRGRDWRLNALVACSRSARPPRSTTVGDVITRAGSAWMVGFSRLIPLARPP